MAIYKNSFTPFYIEHGWHPTPEVVPGQWFFRLAMDGVQIKPTCRRHTPFTEQGSVYFLQTWVLNFPQGMNGQHTFRDQWVATCAYARDAGLTDHCAKPNADFVIFNNQVTTTFVD